MLNELTLSFSPHIDGGPIFAVSGTVLRKTKAVYKVKVRIARKEAVEADGTEDTKYYYMTRAEREDYQHDLSSKEARFISENESSSCLSVKSLLEKVRCEQWVKMFILVSCLPSYISPFLSYHLNNCCHLYIEPPGRRRRRRDGGPQRRPARVHRPRPGGAAAAQGGRNESTARATNRLRQCGKIIC
jgi:hypothetical protein